MTSDVAVRARPRAGAEVRVWDLPTRLFHWTLVALVAVGLVTGFITPEWWMGVHSAAGYGLAALMVFRIVWGFYGSEYSRIASFAYGPRRIIDHLAGVAMLRPAHHIGHNPVGAAMIFALAFLLIALVVTGLLVLGGEEKQGPLASVIGYALGNGAKSVHYALTWLLIAMIAVHVAGVAAESWLTSDNLVWAMITGRKVLPPDCPAPEIRAARPLAAAAVCVVLAGTAAGALLALSSLPSSVRALSPDPLYAKECGACHYAFHPSLLPRASWGRIMAGLDDHFGDDATIAPAAADAIARWLEANAAETWDTEAANRFRVLSPAEPTRITAAPYWVTKHAGIAPGVYAWKSVGGKFNCLACHDDTTSGRFDDQAIRMPKE
jgi:cytochrome b